MKSSPVYTLILALKPTGKRTPYIINTGDRSCTEEVFLYKTNSILDGTLALRIGLIAYPEFQILLRTEIFKNSGFDDFSVSLAGHKYGILIYNKNGWTTAKFAKRPINGLTCFNCIVFVVLCVYAQQAAVSKQQTDEMYGVTPVKRHLSEIYQHLLPGRGIKDMVINTSMFIAGIDLARFLQMVYIVSERLFIARKAIVFSILDELFFEDVVNRGYTVVTPVVCL